jgi:hypothetical protein
LVTERKGEVRTLSAGKIKIEMEFFGFKDAREIDIDYIQGNKKYPDQVQTFIETVYNAGIDKRNEEFRKSVEKQKEIEKEKEERELLRKLKEKYEGKVNLSAMSK